MRSGEDITKKDLEEAAESMDPKHRGLKRFRRNYPSMGAPKVRNEENRLVQCPQCGLVAQVDEDQWAGRVSIDCPDCPYHETHDLSDQTQDQ